MKVHEIIWEYDIPEDRREAFEAAYGADGPWARLFRRADGYIETRLFRDVGRAGAYVTIDRWVSEAAFTDFKRAFAADYRKLDDELAPLSGRGREIR